MKKIKLIAIGLVSLMATGYASAATLVLDSTSNTLDMVTCPLLANDVEIILTASVVGGVDCQDANNVVGLSVCHGNGLTTERSFSFADGITMPSGTVCDDGGTGNGCVETVSGAQFPSASTEKGTVTSRFPGGGATCDTATALSSATDKITEDTQ
jgi:hypothetical protein